MSRHAAIPCLLLALAPSPDPAAAQSAAASLRVSQAVQVENPEPTVRAYLDVVDADGEPLAALAPSALSATVGGAAASAERLEALATSSEGVAYIFLVDVSRSLSDAEFDRIRGAMGLWISSLRPEDRVAIIAFGEASRLVLDFSDDLQAAREALAGLGPTDDLTVFHRALRDALDLAHRRDADLPGRRVLVVLSDGKDEGSGLAAADVLAALRADPVPVYAIGFSRLRSENERRRYLGLLNRLATNSGGAYVEAARGSVEEAYADLLAAVRRVWVATLVCPECRLDGESYRLQVNLADGGRVLSDGRQVRLLPVAAASEPAVAEPTAVPAPETRATGRSGQDATEAAREDDAAGTEPRRRGWWWLAIPLALAGAILAGWWRRGGGRTASEDASDGAASVDGERDPDAAPPEPPPGPSDRPRAYETATGVLTSRPPKPASLRLVRLIVVRGQRVGRQYNMMLLERGVVGARSTCDCVLVEEPGVEPEQFELLQIDGRVYIRNLARHRPTLLDGLPIDEREPLDSQTLVGNSDCILRVIYDEPKRVPL